MHRPTTTRGPSARGRSVHIGPAGEGRGRARGRSFGSLAAVLLAAALTVTGCGASSGGSSSDGKDAAPAGRTDGTAGPAARQNSGNSGDSVGATADTATATPRYVVRTATLSVESKDVAGALARTRTLVVAAGGYVGGENTSLDSAGRLRSSVQLRVPPGAYDKLLADLSGLGALLTRTVDAQDVTSRVIDVASRVKSQQASVERVRALMKRADQLSEVVALENELRTREADLEALQAQQASLATRTDLATVTLRLSEPARRADAPAEKDEGFWAAVGRALSGGWHAFSMTVRWVVMVAAAVLPFALLILAGWWGYRAVRRRLPERPARTARPERTPTWGAPPPPVTVPAALHAPPSPPEGGVRGGAEEAEANGG